MRSSWDLVEEREGARLLFMKTKQNKNMFSTEDERRFQDACIFVSQEEQAGPGWGRRRRRLQGQCETFGLCTEWHGKMLESSEAEVARTDAQFRKGAVVACVEKRSEGGDHSKPGRRWLGHDLRWWRWREEGQGSGYGYILKGKSIHLADGWEWVWEKGARDDSRIKMADEVNSDLVSVTGRYLL